MSDYFESADASQAYLCAREGTISRADAFLTKVYSSYQSNPVTINPLHYMIHEITLYEALYEADKVDLYKRQAEARQKRLKFHYPLYWVEDKKSVFFSHIGAAHPYELDTFPVKIICKDKVGNEIDIPTNFPLADTPIKQRAFIIAEFEERPDSCDVYSENKGVQQFWYTTELENISKDRRQGTVNFPKKINVHYGATLDGEKNIIVKPSSLTEGRMIIETNINRNDFPLLGIELLAEKSSQLHVIIVDNEGNQADRYYLPTIANEKSLLVFSWEGFNNIDNFGDRVSQILLRFLPNFEIKDYSVRLGRLVGFPTQYDLMEYMEQKSTFKFRQLRWEEPPGFEYYQKQEQARQDRLEFYYPLYWREDKKSLFYSHIGSVHPYELQKTPIKIVCKDKTGKDIDIPRNDPLDDRPITQRAFIFSELKERPVSCEVFSENQGVREFWYTTKLENMSEDDTQGAVYLPKKVASQNKAALESEKTIIVKSNSLTEQRVVIDTNISRDAFSLFGIEILAEKSSPLHVIIVDNEGNQADRYFLPTIADQKSLLVFSWEGFSNIGGFGDSVKQILIRFLPNSEIEDYSVVINQLIGFSTQYDLMQYMEQNPAFEFREKSSEKPLTSEYYEKLEQARQARLRFHYPLNWVEGKKSLFFSHVSGAHPYELQKTPIKIVCKDKTGKDIDIPRNDPLDDRPITQRAFIFYELKERPVSCEVYSENQGVQEFWYTTELENVSEKETPGAVFLPKEINVHYGAVLKSEKTIIVKPSSHTEGRMVIATNIRLDEFPLFGIELLVEKSSKLHVIIVDNDGNQADRYYLPTMADQKSLLVFSWEGFRNIDNFGDSVKQIFLRFLPNSEIEDYPVMLNQIIGFPTKYDLMEYMVQNPNFEFREML